MGTTTRLRRSRSLRSSIRMPPSAPGGCSRKPITVRARCRKLIEAAPTLRGGDRRGGRARLLAARRPARLRPRRTSIRSRSADRGNNRIRQLAQPGASRASLCCFSFPASARPCGSTAARAFRADTALTGRCDERQGTEMRVVGHGRAQQLLQCTKAIIRSKLWDPASKIEIARPCRRPGHFSPS